MWKLRLFGKCLVLTAKRLSMPLHDVLNWLKAAGFLVATIIGNWFILLFHQIKLATSNAIADPVIRDRAIRCLIPPLAALAVISMLFTALVLKPSYFTRPITRVLPALPWVIAAIGVAGFAIVARPALWDHTCSDGPIQIQPGNRAQWQDAWLGLNKAQDNEPAWKFRARMEKELDVWAARELDSDDLEEWVNLQAKAKAKRDCLNQKEEIFRNTLKSTRKSWESQIEHWWVKSEV